MLSFAVAVTGVVSVYAQRDLGEPFFQESGLITDQIRNGAWRDANLLFLLMELSKAT